MTSAVWAEYGMRSKRVNYPPPRNLDKIGRLQDWAYLDQTDRRLTNGLYEIGRLFHRIYTFSLHPISMTLASYNNLLVNLSQTQQNISRENMATLLDVSLSVQNLSVANEKLITKIMDLPLYMTTKNGIPDDFYVRCAWDILRNRGKHSKEFFLDMFSMIEETRNMVNATTYLIENMNSLANYSINATNDGNGNATEYQQLTTDLPSLHKENFTQYMKGLDNEYEIVKDDLDAAYDKYMDVFTSVQDDKDLLSTRDWGVIQNEEFYKLNYVGLNIYFDSLSTTRIEQFETDSLTSLICDLGGNLGLFLGGSLLTLVEIIDLLFFLLNPTRVLRQVGVLSTKATEDPHNDNQRKGSIYNNQRKRSIYGNQRKGSIFITSGKTLTAGRKYSLVGVEFPN